MDRKGFTLVELIATLVILGIISTIVIISISGNFGKANKYSEETFVNTIKDAMEVYLDSIPKELDFNDKVCEISKKNGIVSVYIASIDGENITFADIINSKYKPLSESDLVNPANKDVKCNVDAIVNIYRDDDYVYYYSIDKSEFNCLLNIPDDDSVNLVPGTFYKETRLISNLPIIINEDGDEVYACQ